MWELIFMMLILKIPIVYLCLVVYWAVKAEPKPPEPALLPVLPEQPPRGPRPLVARRRPPRRPSPGGPHMPRGATRPARAGRAGQARTASTRRRLVDALGGALPEERALLQQTRVSMPDVDAVNSGYARGLLEQYLENPEAVPSEWRALFESGDGGLIEGLP